MHRPQFSLALGLSSARPHFSRPQSGSTWGWGCGVHWHGSATPSAMAWENLYFTDNLTMTSMAAVWAETQVNEVRLFSHDGKVRILNFNSRCAFWIKIQNTQKRPCVCQITSQNVIWNAHLKSRYRGVFQLRFSQITQRNLCMNDLTSESCFGGRS